MLHASETWPLTKPNLRRLQQNDKAMIRQICNVKPKDIVITRSNELLPRLGIEDLDLVLKERRLSAIDPHDRHTWRSGVRSAMRAASQLSARGLSDVDVALYLHVNQKSDDDEYDDLRKYKNINVTCPASCASCARIIDNKLFCCKKSQQAA